MHSLLSGPAGHCSLRNLLLPAAILAPLFLFSQNEPAPIKYGFIPREDLEMKVYAPDSSAAAVVLCDYGTLMFEMPDNSPYITLARHKRIKFLRRAGFDQGDVKIPYYASLMKIKNLKIQVLAPDGTTSEVPKSAIFDEKVNDKWRRVRFAMPNLQEGSVAEYSYELDSKYIFELPEWYFQEDIPVRWSELRLTIPVWYQYISLLNGRNPDVREAKAYNFIFSGRMTQANYIRMVMKDAPALREESFITTMDDYYARIRFQLKSVHYPEEPIQEVLSTWDKAARDLLEDNSFGAQFTKKSKFRNAWEAAQPDLLRATTAEGKIEALYHFVQHSFEFETFTSVYARQDLSDLFEQKSATRSEANLLLVALLREAGFPADPVLTSTRDHGQPVTEYPVIDQFNHVLALVYLGEKRLLLDAGNSFRPPGMIAVNSLNREGWKVHATRPEWIPIEPQPANEVYFGSFSLDEEGQLNGKIQIVEEGYSAMERRSDLDKKTAGEYWKGKIQERHPDARVDSVVVLDKDNLNKPLHENLNCILPAYAQISGDFIYLNPVFYSAYFENPFKLERRTYPVDMPHPVKERLVTELAVPAGYRVESLPESARFNLPNNGGRFQYIVSQSEGKVTLNATTHLTQLHFEPEEYGALRTFFGMIAEKLGEQLVLKKL